MSNKFVVVDLETTGNSPKKGDKIIQFAAVVVENGKIVDQFSSLVNPEQSIPAFIEELTGLNDHMVENAPLFSEIAPKVLSLLDGAYFVAHNVIFDLSFLQEELVMSGYEGFYGPVLDTVEMARVLFPTADSYKLTDLAAKEGLEHDRPHQADSDAYATAELFLIFMDRLHNLPACTIKQLLKLSGGLKSDLALLLDELALVKEQSIEVLPESIEIFRGLALKKTPEKPGLIAVSEQEYPEQVSQKEALFLKAFPKFEKRLGQFKMMDAVYDSFHQQKHALIEAGTGVGKSLAYLLPAAIFAKQNDQTVVISTYTTQLQEQLLNKDIPLLERMLSTPVRTVLLKGRSHYISLAKFELTLNEEDDNYDTTLTKMQILVWLTETITGDNDELNLSSGGALFWNKIRNDETVFLNSKAWISKDFYLQARKKAQNADLVITNHSQLLADLVSEKGILPHYDYAIIDEGHHFEKAAGKYFGFSFDYLETRMLLGQFGLYEQKQLFYKLEQVINEKTEEQDITHTFEVNQLMSDMILEMDELFKIISIFMKKRAKRTGNSRSSLRLTEEENSREWKALRTSAERFSFLLKDFVQIIGERVGVLKDFSLSTEHKAILEDINTLLKDFAELRDIINNTILTTSEGHVTWIDIDLRSIQNSTTVYAQPISVSEYLRDQWFNKKKSIVITSATLSVKKSFDYIKGELGLTGLPTIVEQIQSPFEYESQIQLVIPNDLPEINSVPLDEYIASISEHIISIAEATKGRMLILFTSYDMLKKTYELMKESGLLEDFAIIAQGVTGGSRARLARNFQRFDKAILLGTSSFWEGIDIPGEDLSCLIIVRLPFSPPDEPLTAAKSELIKKSGGNPFSELSLPEAIIRFKQGFGRLIRTSSDRGLIFVFDRRLITTRYGKAFLESIPPVPVKNQNINEIVSLIDKWL